MNKIKSLNLMVTNKCNGACNMCNIWKDTEFCELDLNDLIIFLKNPQLLEVEDLSISGGEPLLKSDINNFAKELISVLPRLRMFFVNTNGLMPERTVELAKSMISMAKKVNKDLVIYFSISIEGPKEIHEKIRGRSYDQSIKTISLLKELISDEFKLTLSMTIQRNNFKYIKKTNELAKSFGCSFSFRFVDFSNNYYNNFEKNSITLSKKEASHILEELISEFKEDRFFQVLYKSICEGRDDILIDKSGKLVCEAGELFIFIKNNGNIYPCIYSKQLIGNLKDGLFNFHLNRLNNCPCCTECHIYPMINFSKKSNQQYL